MFSLFGMRAHLSLASFLPLEFTRSTIAGKHDIMLLTLVRHLLIHNVSGLPPVVGGKTLNCFHASAFET